MGFKRNIASLLVLIAIVSLSACQNNIKSSGSSGSESSDSGSGGDGATDAEAFAGTSYLGIKNDKQIFDSYTEVTGLDLEEYSNLSSYFEDNRATLPQSNDIGSLGPSHRLAMINLAYEFCDILVDQIDNSNPPENIFTGTAFEQVNSDEHSPSYLLATLGQKEALVTIILDAFWGEDVISFEHREESIQQFSLLIEDLVFGQPDSDQTTRDAIRGVCSAALASAPVVYF